MLIPCLWFADEAEEAANFYVRIFPNSRINTVTRYPEAGREIHGRAPGSVLTVEFELKGHPFTALNGGPVFKFNEAVSFQIICETQEEIDRYWELLTAGGDPAAQQCGWLKDKFGLSWQVVPKGMPEILNHPDRDKANRAMAAMLAMKKIDLAALKAAAEGR